MLNKYVMAPFLWGNGYIKRRKTMIDRFRGPYAFLSNFHPCFVEFDGDLFPSSENAFQAAKWPSDLREPFTRCSPSAAKRMGRVGEITSNWGTRRVEVMRTVLASKFKPGSELARRLLETGTRELVEGNTWGDTFWGVCNGKGENMLGKLLMERRAQLKESK